MKTSDIECILIYFFSFRYSQILVTILNACFATKVEPLEVST